MDSNSGGLIIGRIFVRDLGGLFSGGLTFFWGGGGGVGGGLSEFYGISVSILYSYMNSEGSNLYLHT